jgi:hypothetical protein
MFCKRKQARPVPSESGQKHFKGSISSKLNHRDIWIYQRAAQIGSTDQMDCKTDSIYHVLLLYKQRKIYMLLFLV